MSCVAVSPSSPTLFPLSLTSTDSAGHVVIGCLVQDFFPSAPVNVTWGSSGPGTSIRNFLPAPTSRGLYTMVSQLTLPADQCPDGATQSCHVQHNSSPSKTKNVPCKGNTFPPQVHLLPPPAEELALNELVTLTCVVRGFYPGDVLVRWLHENQELPREKYQTWSPLPEAGQGSTTFATTSVLRVDTEAWKNGDSYSCMVGHEALPLSFTQKTINRLAGKPTHVNVSVVLSEVDGICY
ncbi:Ig alpha-1 chain C region [Myotis brandtii]|uniref:Ig alpha-1 chain C region n=1 Tax=Myotis brandtii TaxID=109478 RepID=S7PZJ0_MYOBR|nr:Ig alpha-1 chain C region [Myotis brandtii]